MNATTHTTPTEPLAPHDRGMFTHIGFFTGRGDDATITGHVITFSPTPSPDPAAIAALPVGRDLLAATTADDFERYVDEFAGAWAMSGFGDGAGRNRFSRTSIVPTLGKCPDASGRTVGGWSGPVYAFDDGQVFYYLPNSPDRAPHEGQWHTITLAGARGELEISPATRRYGESYHHTAALDLPQLAAWLMAELTALGRDTDTAVPPGVRYAAVVNTARAEIKLYLYDLTATDDTRHVWAAVADAAAAHDWTNSRDLHDRRFMLWTYAPGGYDLARLRELGRHAGTVTTVTDPNPCWT